MFDLAAIFQPRVEWPAVATEIDHTVTIADLKTGGVNPGDRRAIYQLIRYFKPMHVLEVGTHVGASTLHIAAALRSNGSGALTTVDVVDVNAFDGPWAQHGLRCSPVDAITRVDMLSRVRFVQGRSVDFLGVPAESAEYDFIFLDGDHEATTVYQELPLAIARLRAGGTILLHDYFPNGEALWKDSPAICGPFEACAKLKSEGTTLDVFPLGELPWLTKFESRVTSLALVKC